MERIELKPYFEVKPWAGEKLEKIFNAPKKTGEAWLVSCIKNKNCILANGECLSDVVSKNHVKLGLKENDEFPVLIKIIDAAENLSIQVHPDDEYAISKGFKNGKYECWYILNETTTNKIIFGIDNVKEDVLKSAINAGNLEKYLEYQNIKPYDLLKVTPGTVHAIMGGTFLLEVQDPCDITYRLYDYNRLPRRELHIEDSLNVIYKKHKPVDLDKYMIIEKADYYEITIKNFDRFYFEVFKGTYKTFLVIK